MLERRKVRRVSIPHGLVYSRGSLDATVGFQVRDASTASHRYLLPGVRIREIGRVSVRCVPLPIIQRLWDRVAKSRPNVLRENAKLSLRVWMTSLRKEVLPLRRGDNYSLPHERLKQSIGLLLAHAEFKERLHSFEHAVAGIQPHPASLILLRDRCARLHPFLGSQERVEDERVTLDFGHHKRHRDCPARSAVSREYPVCVQCR